MYRGGPGKSQPLTQRALGCLPRRNTLGKCPDKATYSHAYPAGHIVGLLDKILSGICLAYLLVNVGYSNRFSMWDYRMNIWQKTWDFRSWKISCHRTLLTFSDCKHGWKTGSIHTIIPHGKSIGISYINQQICKTYSTKDRSEERRVGKECW